MNLKRQKCEQGKLVITISDEYVQNLIKMRHG